MVKLGVLKNIGVRSRAPASASVSIDVCVCVCVCLHVHLHAYVFRDFQSGFVVGMAALGFLFCSYIDIMAVSEYTGCTNCDRGEYIATCLFAMFSFISMVRIEYASDASALSLHVYM